MGNCILNQQIRFTINLQTNENKTDVARIVINKKSFHIGCFNTEEEAARAYDAKAIELFGEFARLNFPT